MKFSLCDAIRESQTIEEQIVEAGGELTRELETSLLSINLNVAEKVDATQFVLERLAKSAEYWREKSEDYRRIGAALENAQKRLREHIKQVMMSSGKRNLLGNDVRYLLSPHQPKLHIEEERLSEAYKKEVLQFVPDLEKIREDLELGILVEGAELEPVYTLRHYPNTKAAKVA